MTGPEHYRKAEELLGQADQLLDGDEPSAATWAIGKAQAHATLALAAATAIGTAGTESRSWADAAGTKLPTGSTNRGAPRSLPAMPLALVLRGAGPSPSPSAC